MYARSRNSLVPAVLDGRYVPRRASRMPLQEFKPRDKRCREPRHATPRRAAPSHAEPRRTALRRAAPRRSVPRHVTLRAAGIFRAATAP